MHFTTLVALASLGHAVAKARVRCKVKAPATIGAPAFESIYRVQTNTLEWLPIDLPSLWLFGFYVSNPGAAFDIVNRTVMGL